LAKCQIWSLIQGYKVHGSTTLNYASHGQSSNYKLSKELRLKCLTLFAEHLHGFGPTMAHEKLKTAHGFNISVATLRCRMITAEFIAISCDCRILGIKKLYP
ncbi:hypothetical protein OHW74_18315, partial [Acinetobacter baumannii]|nr:hypothetical protein [Acinetobacter baumannii]